MCLLHVRGGVSSKSRFGCRHQQSSPRPWRCFSKLRRIFRDGDVFSTSVEVFPSIGLTRLFLCRLLHVLGGVSNVTKNLYTIRWSSPRPWRCFRRASQICRITQVFSTSVEVFLSKWLRLQLRRSLLHVCGGVSKEDIIIEAVESSSPRPWRCFRFSRGLKTAIFVFSTSVEVFPKSFFRTCPKERLLHVRGGVFD